MSTDPFKNENSLDHSQTPRTVPDPSQGADGRQNPSVPQGRVYPQHTAGADSSEKAEDAHQPSNPGQDRHPRTGHLNLPGHPGEHLNAMSPESLPPQNSYALPHTLPGYSGYAVPSASAYPYTAYPANPHDEIVRKRSLMYLLRLCIVGTLIMLGLIVTILTLIGAIIELSDCGSGSYSWSEFSRQSCRAENTTAIVMSSIFIVAFIAYPICHIFGWLAVKNNQHAIRVRVISIVGIVLSSLGILLSLLTLIGGLAMGPAGIFVAFIAVVITGAIPVAELIFSIIFLKHSLWMTRDNVFNKPAYQLP